MSSWNYRLVHRKHYGRTPEFDEDVYAIHEVYYDNDGKVRAVSTDPSPVYANDMQGIEWVLRKMQEAYTKDVLEWDNIPDKTAKPFGSDSEPFGVTLDGE